MSKAKSEEEKKAEAEAKAAAAAAKKAEAEIKKAEKAAKKEGASLPIDRDNLTYITAGFWRYQHKGDLSECDVDGAFLCLAGKEFNIRKGDVVLCSNEKEVVHVVVK